MKQNKSTYDNKNKQPVYYNKNCKNRTTAILLSVFLSHWTWCYTYREDIVKFWIALISNLLLWWTFIVPLGIWIWTIIDTTRRNDAWYEQYFL